MSEPAPPPAAAMTPMARVRSVALGDGLHAVPEPHPAVTVVIVREGRDQPVEVLLMRRPAHMRFAAGVWVFPGGRVDAGETHAQAAVREVAEEIALALAVDALAPLDWWITPEPETRRFDVRFLVARAPDGQLPVGSPDEVDEWRWIAPAAALEAGLPMLRPTMSVLQRLATARTVDEAVSPVAGLVPRMPRPFAVDDAITWHVVNAATGEILERSVAMPRWEATP